MEEIPQRFQKLQTPILFLISLSVLETVEHSTSLLEHSDIGNVGLVADVGKLVLRRYMNCYVLILEIKNLSKQKKTCPTVLLQYPAECRLCYIHRARKASSPSTSEEASTYRFSRAEENKDHVQSHIAQANVTIKPLSLPSRLN